MSIKPFRLLFSFYSIALLFVSLSFKVDNAARQVHHEAVQNTK